MSSVNKADSQRWGRAAQERDGEGFDVPEKWLLGRVGNAAKAPALAPSSPPVFPAGQERRQAVGGQRAGACLGRRGAEHHVTGRWNLNIHPEP